MARLKVIFYCFAICLITGYPDNLMAQNVALVQSDLVVSEPEPLNPWAEMEKKERDYRAEIAILKARQTAYQQPPARPTPSVLVRGNQALKLSELAYHPLPVYESEPSAAEVRQKPSPTMGRIYTEYPGSHLKTWRFAPKKTEYR